ncbi:desmethylxanthohumol 6'-O-methyltransferase-like [Nymphaea colorata]|nr:desmethylxanthohumol 6'-O-methyltransferase-like [Nymphaea colorata]
MEMEEERLVQGQIEIFQQLFAFADSMLLKCAVELGIADIIHRNGRPMTLHQIAAELPAPSPDISSLFRIMRLLVRKHVFVRRDRPIGGENGANSNPQPEFGLTSASRWLVRDGELSLAPMVLMQNYPSTLPVWHCLSRSVKEGGVAFEKVLGVDLWGYGAANPEFNQLFNSAMVCTCKIIMKAVMAEYDHGFSRFGSLVDVGGGTGKAIAEIVKSYPHVKGINLDLPHVVATAPRYQGVTHVGGDMFEEIPKADAVFMKWILHNWSDEDCIKILKQCKKAIPENTGMVMLVEVVLQCEANEDAWKDIKMVLDVTMLVYLGGKERTEAEWRKLLKGGGFNHCNITPLHNSLFSLIEAFPN